MISDHAEHILAELEIQGVFFVQNNDIFQDVSVIREIAAQQDRHFFKFAIKTKTSLVILTSL